MIRVLLLPILLFSGIGIGAVWPQQPLRIIVREELSTHLGSRYLGHIYRETRAALREDDGSMVGEVYRLEQTLTNSSRNAHQVERSETIRFGADAGGVPLAIRFPKEPENGAGHWPFPYAAFPQLPATLPGPGGSWEAQSTYYADPLNSGNPIRIPFACRYTFVRMMDFQGEKVYEITGQFAVRRGAIGGSAGKTASAGPFVSGRHTVTILVAVDGTGIRLIRDLVDEQYRYPPGTDLSAALPQASGPLDSGTNIPTPNSPSPETLRFSGFLLAWFTPTAPLDRGLIATSAARELGTPESSDAGGAPAAGGPSAPVGALAPSGPPALNEPPARNRPAAAGGTAGAAAAASQVPDVSVDNRPDGVRITLSNVHFLPDRAEVVPADASRLSRIAAVLKSVPDRTIRVIGYTADVGNPAGQKTLSAERARAVVDYLVKAGIPASRFIYEGRGAADPVADNSSESGRSKNRRVEITILQD